MTLLRLALCSALIAPLSFAQDAGLPASSQPDRTATTTEEPDPSTTRQGRFRSEPARPRTRFLNRNELDAHSLLPPGYTYDATGKEESYVFLPDVAVLTSPDGGTKITLTRFEGEVLIEPAKVGLTAVVDGVRRKILENPQKQLESLLRARARPQGAGRYTVRAWLVDRDSDCLDERAVLVDAVRATVKKHGQQWLEQSYRNNERVYFVEGNFGYGVKAKRVELLRIEPTAGMSSALKSE